MECLVQQSSFRVQHSRWPIARWNATASCERCATISNWPGQHVEWSTGVSYEGWLRPAFHAPCCQKGVTAVWRTVTVSLMKLSERMRAKRVKLQWPLWTSEKLVQAIQTCQCICNMTVEFQHVKHVSFCWSFFTGPPTVPPMPVKIWPNPKPGFDQHSMPHAVKKVWLQFGGQLQWA